LLNNISAKLHLKFKKVPANPVGPVNPEKLETVLDNTLGTENVFHAEKQLKHSEF
jgi:hypothetical protein